MPCIYRNWQAGKFQWRKAQANHWSSTPKRPPDFIHGADGLGNLNSREPSDGRVLDGRSAAQFIVDMAHQRPGEITLVPVGPLTNIAAAFALEPQLPQLVKQVVLMGGAVKEAGNVSPVAEANIWNDPHAADTVFTAGFDLAMVGLDVTYQVVVPVSMMEAIAQQHQHPLTDTLMHAVRFYANFYATRYPALKDTPGCFGHDVMAFIALLHPELFQWATGRLRCVTDGITQGQTVWHDRLGIDFPQQGFGAEVPLSRACMQVDVPRVLELFRATLSRPWLHS